MLFLYHITSGGGDPLAEQLTRTNELTLGTVIAVDGLSEKAGGSELMISTGVSIKIPKFLSCRLSSSLLHCLY